VRPDVVKFLQSVGLIEKVFLTGTEIVPRPRGPDLARGSGGACVSSGACLTPTGESGPELSNAPVRHRQILAARRSPSPWRGLGSMLNFLAEATPRAHSPPRQCRSASPVSEAAWVQAGSESVGEEDTEEPRH